MSESMNTIRVAIAGAGGLGSNVAMHLVRSGFKNLFLVDFDIVEESNLNRQFYFKDQIGQVKVNALKENLLRIYPDVNIHVLQKKITSDNVDAVFADYDICIEAFDKADYKAMFVSSVASMGKFLVSGNGMAGYGNTDDIVVNKISEKLFVVGDMSRGVSDENPPISPRVGVVASKMADIVLEYVCLKQKK